LSWQAQRIYLSQDLLQDVLAAQPHTVRHYKDVLGVNRGQGIQLLSRVTHIEGQTLKDHGALLLDLTEAELGEEVTKVLTPTNTNVIRNLVVYSFKEGEFVLAPIPGNTVTLIAFPGNSLHVDSEEGRRQIEESDEIGYPLPMPNYTVVEQREPENVDGEEGEGEEDEDGAK